MLGETRAFDVVFILIQYSIGTMIIEPHYLLRSYDANSDHTALQFLLTYGILMCTCVRVGNKEDDISVEHHWICHNCRSMLFVLFVHMPGFLFPYHITHKLFFCSAAIKNNFTSCLKCSSPRSARSPSFTTTTTTTTTSCRSLLFCFIYL
jgi:hypothetical protein